MNDSYGTTDIAKREPTSSGADLALDEIDEIDIRTLVPYNWDNDGETLVGIGPVTTRVTRKSAPKAADQPPESKQPASEQPGPWGSHDEALPPTVRRKKKLGIWSVALPALLVAAGVAVAFLRVLAVQRPAERSASVAPPVARATAGLAVALTRVNVRVFLDGQDRGRPPLLLTELTPGSHVLSISGPGFAPYEQPVLLVSDRVSTVEPKLTFLHGAIRLVADATAAGANVEVVGGNERRVIETLPARLEAAPGSYEVHARRPGFFAFETRVELTATSPEPEVRIALTRITPLNSGLATRVLADGNGTGSSGTLSITSSPPANIVLDGRPLGKAPRSVDVPAGNHTVTFVHPKYGRQSVTVNVSPDQTTSASADF
jgi:hypothetical protein